MINSMLCFNTRESYCNQEVVCFTLPSTRHMELFSRKADRQTRQRTSEPQPLPRKDQIGSGERKSENTTMYEKQK